MSYRGREDGWVLTANKRGPTLVPSEDQAAAAGEFEAQEAAFAEAAAAGGGGMVEDAAERPLTGAKPPAAAGPVGEAGVVAGEDRPLTGGGGGKGSWEAPSEFPPGHEAGAAPSSVGGGSGGDEPVTEASTKDVAEESAGGSAEGGASGSAEYMTALGCVHALIHVAHAACR